MMPQSIDQMSLEYVESRKEVPNPIGMTRLREQQDVTLQNETAIDGAVNNIWKGIFRILCLCEFQVIEISDIRVGFEC